MASFSANVGHEPVSWRTCRHSRSTRSRNGLSLAKRGNFRPKRVESMALSADAPALIAATIISSANGCSPSPNSARMCASVTCRPATSRRAAPRPSHRPGGAPSAV